MKKNISIGIAIFCYVFPFFSLALAHDHVLVEGKLISISAKSISLEKILTELHHKTGIIFIVDDQVNDEKISLKLEKQTLDKVLTRLLKSYGQIFTYGSDGSINRIEIFKKDTKTFITKETDGSNAVPKGKPELIRPTEFDPKMDIVDIGEEGLELDDPTPITSSDGNMKITDSPEEEMEIILPEKSNLP